MATKKDMESLQSVDLAAVQAEIAKMLAEAKAEANKIVEEAKKAVDTNHYGMSAEELAAYKAHMNEKVRIKLFKDNGKYKDPVPVGVNGEIRRIPRGEYVEIERKFAEVLDNSEHQDYETAQMIEKKASDWAAMSKNL